MKELEPPTEGLAAGVSVEGTRHTLLCKPVVGAIGDVTKVLSIHTGEQLGVDQDGCTLDEVSYTHMKRETKRHVKM